VVESGVAAVAGPARPTPPHQAVTEEAPQSSPTQQQR